MSVPASPLSFTCRSCGATHGELVLDLGLQPLANNLLRPEDLGKPEPKFPLRVPFPDSWRPMCPIGVQSGVE